MSSGFNKSVEAELDKLLKLEQQQAPTEAAKLLLDRIRSMVLRGGKRMRPALLSMTYAAYGGKQSELLLDLGVALELHHQFLLIHDDLIDDDSVRNLGPNIIGYYRKDYGSGLQHIPESMALIAGDLVATLVNKVVMDSKSYSEKQKIELMTLINNATKVTIYGQQLDTLSVDLEDKSLGLKKFELVSSLKTAAYSARLPMQCAAALLNLSSVERNKIDRFAECFGVLFQLVDDYSDYFDDVSVSKSRTKYRDFAQGKITYPLYIASKQLSTQDFVFLKQGLGKKNIGAKDLEKVLNILINGGVQEESKQLLNKYYKSTYKALGELKIGKNSSAEFIKMIEGFGP
jgi:geranylgeranyl diphosphate synthase, type I